MKKIFLLALVSSFAMRIYSQSSNNGKIRLGLGGAYASEVDGSGITIKGIYSITSKWEAGITYSHFFENLGLSWNVLDINGHFVFYDNDKKFNTYILTGLALTYWERETIGNVLIPSETRTGTYTGINLGVGANFALSKHINMAPELRGTFFDVSYTRIGLTFQYIF